MEKEKKTYIAIDLKSFFASVECVERGLDPLGTNLVVADETRTEKTICLAVTPSLKAWGISGRARLFEVIQRVDEINRKRRAALKGGEFSGISYLDSEIRSNPETELSYIVAKPRMAKYIEYSNRIFDIYLSYFSSDDIHSYSVDEVFIDATAYLDSHKRAPAELTMEIVLSVLKATGITATAGIGSNLFLCKVAMDIQAKKMPADKNGVRIAELNEESFKDLLWDHQPITDFWQIGAGTANRLYQYGIHTMRDIANCSEGKDGDFYNKKLLYKLFGVNAEVLIDHSWGEEYCTIADIKNYVPQSTSLSKGQVLKCPYSYEETATVLAEMAESLSLELLSKKMVTDMLTLVIGYDNESVNLKQEGITVINDRYGRPLPKWDRGTVHLPFPSSLTSLITEALLSLYERTAKKYLTIRRITISAENTKAESELDEDRKDGTVVQMNLFGDEEENSGLPDISQIRHEKVRQTALLEIKEKYGKNSILNGTNFRPGATAIERNGQIGGHKA